MTNNTSSTWGENPSRPNRRRHKPTPRKRPPRQEQDVRTTGVNPAGDEQRFWRPYDPADEHASAEGTPMAPSAPAAPNETRPFIMDPVDHAEPYVPQAGTASWGGQRAQDTVAYRDPSHYELSSSQRASGSGPSYSEVVRSGHRGPGPYPSLIPSPADEAIDPNAGLVIDPDAGVSGVHDAVNYSGYTVPTAGAEPLEEVFGRPYDDPLGAEQAEGVKFDQFGRVNEGFVSADPISVQRGKSYTLRYVLIGLVLLAVVAAVGWAIVSQSTITVIINGMPTNVRHNSTLSQVFDADRWGISPGNLVSVNGTVLAEGQGDAFKATVNGKEVGPSEAVGITLSGSEQITFEQGADVCEEYTAEITNTQPRLLMEGEGGTVSYLKQWGRAGRMETRHGTTSGETADVVVQPAQDCIVAHVSPVPADGRKLVALAFYSGPSYYTSRLLDILQRNNARATFFTLGDYVEVEADLAKSVVDAGMQVASCGQTDLNLAEATNEQLQGEISGGFAALMAATGMESSCFSAPLGQALTPAQWLATNGSVTVAIQGDVHADSERYSADEILAKVEAETTNGSIIVMHDGGGDRTHDVIALPDILSWLTSEGYEVVSVAELLASDPSIPAEVATCAQRMPADALWPTELG